MNVNRELKNSVFTTLFNDEDKVRELYAAIKGVGYDPKLPVVITTLQDVLYMNQINDLSFTAEEKMALIVEHQSSLNHNMPLRILMYMSRVYEKIVDRKSLYKDTLVKIPRPEFIVLYNGLDDTPDRWEERLSQAYMEVEGNQKISLDLVVTVYNINKGRNPELLNRSENLAGYAEFVARVREHEKAMPRDQAVTEAVRSCIREGILAGFLEEHGSEVMNMLLEEWNLDEAKEVWLEEGMEKGVEIGVEKDRNQILELIDQGYTTEQLKAKLTEGLQNRR
ncbi:MAG: Rpn family recombination-promoting nuclease/putative transposase [Treponema sp.]|jgi:hypothetical protein|nr:Rpn family recombination-promoting nuclease/putative transposase [Treponema sp.]